MFYSVEKAGFFSRQTHGESVPADAVEVTKSEYEALLAGLSAGQVIAINEAGRPLLISPTKTADQLEDALTAVLNQHLDTVARQRRYDSRFTCSLRAGFPGPFQEEGQVFAGWMDACNMAAYQLMAEVKAGSRAVPTEADLIAAMPVIEWPPSPIPAGAA